MTTSEQDGYETAVLERECGYPAYFYALGGDGDYVGAVSRRYGLPIRLLGDRNPNLAWAVGFNRAVRDSCEREGPPWNTRFESLDVLARPRTYYESHAAGAVTLVPGGPGLRAGHLELSLVAGSGIFPGPSVSLTADDLFLDPGLVPGAMRSGRGRVAAPGRPTPEGRPPRGPAVGHGTASVWLRFWNAARSVSCVPGPPDSHLAVFRFADFSPEAWGGSPTRVIYVALDTQLAEWLPGGFSEPEFETPRQPG